ncbi:MAG: ComEC/Rec2 family competence protein [Nostocales cyanobacterium]|nr:MAG: ComEC/Rec2 family competence protein [Nostocales cyanobacterium]TAF10540.1 MAG: ComEC/Rec2 family competence protein [Nostocales cyanobacterium]
MMPSSSAIICLAYILGLLFTAVPWGGVWVLGLGILGAVFFRRISIGWRVSNKREKSITKARTGNNLPLATPHPNVWLIAGLVGLLATFYFNLRIPQPGAKDISNFVSSENNNNQEQLVIVRGKVASNPRLTRSQRGQFWLEAMQLDEVKNDQGPSDVPQGVTGKLYVTVPILQATGLYPEQEIAVTGMLYKPKAASNPGAFDFQKYLKQEGTFAGLVGKQINVIDEERKWGWWQVREQIVQSHVRFLGVPEGTLVSAMVLGGKAVDLPYDIRDLFVKVGLAHALAASGFQTSLILGVILQLTRKTNKGVQFFCGSLGLIAFLCLAGFQASILRSVIMGFAALIGLALERKVQQLGSLLLAANLLLLFNPVWIWDLGFQLSFLATLGLIVTATPITKRLDWLPPIFASLIAVPLAATVWTLPLLLHIFSVVAVYSVPLNIITTPFISVISIGGMFSGLVSLIVPDLGSYLSSFLYYPTHLLIQIAEFFANLPGSSVAVGSISIWQMLIIYGLIIATCLVRWWQKRWWFAIFLTIILVVVPVWYSTNNLLRITLLATDNEPILVIQDRGKVTLINSGSEGTGRFTILPFLKQQGVNQIDLAISSDFFANENDAWLEVVNDLPIKSFYAYSAQLEKNLEIQAIQNKIGEYKGIYQPLGLGQVVNMSAGIVQFVNDALPIFKLQIFGQNWLLIGNVKSQQVEQLMKNGSLSSPQVLWCLPESLQDLVKVLKPSVAIATTNNLDNKTISAMSQETKLFFTGKDGAIQWTPNDGFQAFIQVTENKSSNL